MIGIGEMQFIPNIDPIKFGTIKRRVVLRVGRVENVHPEGHYMLKVPSVQTSVAVFPGMSGGIVARWTGPNTQIQPFGFISHSMAPPTHPPTYNDRSLSGQSIGVILNMKRTIISEKKQQVAIQIKHDGIGLGDLSAPRVINQHYGDVIMKNEQKPHLIAVQALLCDDVRHEFNGKQIIIGVYGDNILVPSLPTSITLCLWMRFKAPSAGAYVIDWSVIGARLQQLAPVQSINVDVKDSTGHVDVNVKSTLNINEPEVLRFQWRDNGGEWKDALSIEMGLQPTPVTLAISQPPS
jgi:hypothetical protein